MTVSAWYLPLSISAWETPTVAISGDVNTLEATRCFLSGETESPSRCAMAIRPCIAATDAKGITPVQSPAAYTFGAVVRETPSTTMWPESFVVTPAFSSPRSLVFGIEPTARRQCEPETLRPSERVTITPSPSRSTDAARERGMTLSPRRSNTSSRTFAASSSSLGRTRSREEIRVTSAPRPR